MPYGRITVRREDVQVMQKCNTRLENAIAKSHIMYTQVKSILERDVKL